MPTAPTLASGSVTVRMYRGILGDCFLLRYSCADAPAVHILIDCGVLQGVEGAKALITNIVDDIYTDTGGIIDLLVVTHEHHDHLSGFIYAKERFASQFQIRELWLAWTEDPNDAQAARLRQRFDKAKHTLAALAMDAQVRALSLDQPKLRTVLELSAFMGVGELTTARTTGASTLQMLKDKATARCTRYLQPGDIANPASADSLRAYVLGPPRDDQLLRKDLPSAGANKEVYLTDLDDVMALDSQLLRLQGQPPSDDEVPFSRLHQRPLAPLQALYTAACPPAPDRRNAALLCYFDPAQATRQINDEWQDTAETLALKMDSDTNNTSLVLAFELPDQQVLLFPGDAQVGNWLSWSRQTYPPVQGLAVDDLLRRVTFYKVGHHCSHNATLRELGLMKMTDPRLIAAIPVVGEVAKLKDWQMPYPDLYQALLTQTNGRVLRGDGDPKAEQAAFAKAPTAGPRTADLRYGQDNRWVEVEIFF